MTNKDHRVVLTRLSYVVYQHPDLKKFKSFAKDFGLQEVDSKSGSNTAFFRGYGKDQYVYIAHQAPRGGEQAFLGSGFCAQSADDIDRASRIPGSQLLDISSQPGGGRCVRVEDPNGYFIEVIYDQLEHETPQQGVSVVKGGRPAVNGALDKTRKGEFTRMVKSPAMVHKLGHFGYNTDNYDDTFSWYTTNFNIRPTDVLHAPDNSSLAVASFSHLDLGKEYVDHHCFLLVRSDKPGTTIHHSSFEVEDLDTQMIGHQHLLDQGHDSVWGIGRHIYGSQLFDYWYDSSKFIIEHYADGDLVNEDSEMVRAAVDPGKMAIWGPPVPAVWGGKKISA